jgi:nitroimidazol reductase NimA-like FMN-containing flavoprotein (pyridoxamine 5'-phosphate oxidase superfamily)
MSDRTTGDATGSQAQPGPGHESASPKSTLERLDEAESMRLISPGGVGRLAYSGRFGLTIMPVNYRIHEGSIVFRTEHDSPTDEDLRTGIAGAEYQVAFEVDDVDADARAGWSVLVQGGAHHVDSPEEYASVLKSGVESWAGGIREHFLRIIPTRITGRRVRQG